MKRPRCALYSTCYKPASGIQSDGKGNLYTLCYYHKNIYDWLGREEFNKRFEYWLKSEPSPEIISWCKKCHVVLGKAKEGIEIKELFHRCGGMSMPVQLGDIENIPERKISHIGNPCLQGSRHSDCIKVNCWCGCHRKLYRIKPKS